MEAGLSKGKVLVRTLKEARAAFHRSGKSVVSWAKENGFCPQLVYLVLSGQRKGLRGQTHKIAVRLGIKDGVIEGTTEGVLK
jgi:gp16 family phage-associated protein